MPAMNVLANLFVTIYNTEARRKSEWCYTSNIKDCKRGIENSKRTWIH